MKTRALCFLAAVAVAVSTLSAQNRPAPSAADIPRIQFEKYTLPNGLEVILSQDRRLPIVAVNLWDHVGPGNESAGPTGLAPPFEHLMFPGSKHTPKDSHFQMLQAAGATGIHGTT